MPDGPLNAADRAADRAFKRGQESNLLTQHIEDDTRRFGELKDGLASGTRAVAGVGERLGKLERAFERFVTEAETRAEAAKERAEKQVTNRTLVLTAIGLFFGLGMLLIAGLALIHGSAAP